VSGLRWHARSYLDVGGFANQLIYHGAQRGGRCCATDKGCLGRRQSAGVRWCRAKRSGARALDHPAQTLEDGGDTDGIVEKRAHIGDAHLNRRKARAGAHVPPQLGRIPDQPSLHHEGDRALKLSEALKRFGRTGPRQLVEHAQPV